MAKEHAYFQISLNMSENSKMENMMAKVNFFGKKDKNIQVILKTIKLKEKVSGNQSMVIHMKAILKMGNSMVMELKKQRMGKYISVISKMINMKEKE